jgi:hypothetical protein
MKWVHRHVINSSKCWRKIVDWFLTSLLRTFAGCNWSRFSWCEVHGCWSTYVFAGFDLSFFCSTHPASSECEGIRKMPWKWQKASEIEFRGLNCLQLVCIQHCLNLQQPWSLHFRLANTVKWMRIAFHVHGTINCDIWEFSLWWWIRWRVWSLYPFNPDDKSRHLSERSPDYSSHFLLWNVASRVVFFLMKCLLVRVY